MDLLVKGRWYALKLKEYDITLDIKKKTTNHYIEVVQGDRETNVLNIKLTNGEKDYQIEDNQVEIAFKRPDETIIIQNDLEFEDNLIRCVLDTDTISIPGKVLGEVRIKNDKFLLTTSQFQFYVRQAIR